MIKAAILGFGTVGSGVFNVINTNREVIERRIGDTFEIKYVLDLREFPGNAVEDVLTHDFKDIINDPEIKVVAEVMGGVKPAYEFTKQCLEAGKSVCTSNKELVAAHGPELIKTARENNANYFFEASCGGGIPIIRAINECLTADRIDEISGILNGTTNYILTEMAKNGSAFEDALKEAQDLGYAEKDPTADIEGFDVQRKIAILSSLAFGKTVKHDEILTEGISGISPVDIEFAKAMDCSIKLLAHSVKRDGKYFAMVAPFMVGKEHPLYPVEGVFNAVFVHGNMLGDAMFYGSGAGSLPTASAVAADMVEAAKNIDKTLSCEWGEGEIELSDPDAFESRFFIRVPVDKENDIKGCFDGKVKIIRSENVKSEIGILTGKISEAEYKEKTEGLDFIIGRIRYK